MDGTLGFGKSAPSVGKGELKGIIILSAINVGTKKRR